MGVLGRLRKSVYRLRQNVFLSSMVAYPFNFAMLSHVGRVRKGNEDTCAASIEAGAFVVCDGMGGAAAGEVASLLAAETFLDALTQREKKSRRRNSDQDDSPEATPQKRLDSAIHAANQAVFQQSRRGQDQRGMGTTLVALLLAPAAEAGGRPTLTLAHVGDSRCYRFREGSLDPLTADHSLVEEQVRAGELTPFEAQHHPWRNIITRAIGSQARVEAEIQPLDPRPGDLYLLASDGLTRELTDAEIAGIIRQAYTRERPQEAVSMPIPVTVAGASSAMRRRAGASVERAGTGAEIERIRENIRGFDLASLCQQLVDAANEAGGGDNITVLLLAIK